MSVELESVVVEEKEMINHKKLKNITRSFLKKSKEAYKLAIEIFNKPTIQYRSEGFCFFICNAWDLLLKAKIVEEKGIEYIYRENKKNETKSLIDLLNYAIPSRTDYTRKNIETVYSLRNQATHFILKEFDIVYAPIFQACVINYSNKFFDYFGCYPMNDKNNYIVLVSDVSQINQATIMKKYNKASAKMLIKALEEIKENNNSEKFSMDLNVDLKMRLERNKSKADINFAYTNDSQEAISTIEKYVDMSKKYEYTYTTLEKSLKEKFGTIPFFNSKNLATYCKRNSVYENSDYFYKHIEGSTAFKKYSKQFLDVLIIEFQNDINMLSNYK